jgi:hypothetical protein
MKITKEYGMRADDSFFQTEKPVFMPKQKGNKVVTLNNQGFMRVELDEFSRKWVSEAITSGYPFLEIGAAYGQASVMALEGGATIIANDIEMEHLRVIKDRVSVDLQKKLYLNGNSFPDKIDIPDNSLGGVLFCRVGHFFTEEKMLDSLKKIHDMLAVGGSLFFVSVSPYHYTLLKDFLPVFLERKKRGDKNPGYIDNMKKYMPSPESSIFIPNFLNAWDISTISRLLKINSFKINRAELFDYSQNNSQGKGFVGIEARKIQAKG